MIPAYLISEENEAGWFSIFRYAAFFKKRKPFLLMNVWFRNDNIRNNIRNRELETDIIEIEINWLMYGHNNHSKQENSCRCSQGYDIANLPQIPRFHVGGIHLSLENICMIFYSNFIKFEHYHIRNVAPRTYTRVLLSYPNDAPKLRSNSCC